MRRNTIQESVKNLKNKTNEKEISKKIAFNSSTKIPISQTENKKLKGVLANQTRSIGNSPVSMRSNSNFLKCEGKGIRLPNILK